MTLLVTGGGGFVMANLIRHWLERAPSATAILLDAYPLDGAAQRFFKGYGDRLTIAAGDVTKAETWQMLPGDIDYVVHGAAVTPTIHVDGMGKRRDPEREDPVGILSTNIMGTAQALDWARRLKALQRFVYVSTGGVYVDKVREQESNPFPLPEDGYLGPKALYGVSKYASEMIARRFAALYELPVTSVRLSGVFGPMDRRTPARAVRNDINRMVHRAFAGGPLTARTPDSVGDYVYAPDVADAIVRILLAEPARLLHPVYNIGSGVLTRLADLVAIARTEMPNLAIKIVDEGPADIDDDGTRRTGQWSAYDITRAKADLDWSPRPLRETIPEYMRWVRENPI
jgi:UDP-glucose 4-epimerase